jgi:hypothetical protein
MSIKITVFQDMKMEAAYSSEMLVPHNCQTIYDVMSQKIILTGFKFLRLSDCVGRVIHIFRRLTAPA